MVTVKKKNIKSTLDVYSSHWSALKSIKKFCEEDLFNVCVGIILGDASLYKHGPYDDDVSHKFIRNYKQIDFLNHLSDTFSRYTFLVMAGLRTWYDKEGKPFDKIYWFDTSSYYRLTELWNLFYKSGKKGIVENLIKNHLAPIGFAQWVMCDGSLQKGKKVIVLHTYRVREFACCKGIK